MQQLNIKKIETEDVSVDGLSALMDQKKIEFNVIGCVNWNNYSYKPEVKFRVAHSDNAILINYQVEEDSVRAAYGEDSGNVWTDSCVEFFVIPANDGIYYNIESSCIGTVLLAAGENRHARERASSEVLAGIQRWASLGRESFEERIGKCSWELSLIIPYTAFFKHSIKSLDGVSIKGNFYKCGDQLKTPHFLSWNPIETVKPDFHRSEFFGELYFE
ncbi:carbohydrate-binding family 9-like protein [uncultured Bacteroides sp.]|uniref:carbohydrate-binding family 9-like protein n=1 Tax=uncultured Bacteroides sp. TaxID=162156 RepID=UPI0037495BF2